MRKWFFPKVSIVLLLFAAACAASMAEQPRTPRFPLKTQRRLLSDEQIALARKNIANYPAAKKVADSIIKKADKLLKWSDRDLRSLIPSADVPRAFNVGTEGCPKCGKKIYESGTYPWIIDPRRPFKVKCPVDGAVFPDNDFTAYYRSRLKDKRYLKGKYADDGWGWVSPDGHRYWFVAYANHWMWRNYICPAVLDLARAYVLTGDNRFAHKAVVMLDRIAEVYPAMDYHNQSRYGQLEKARGAYYGGKIVNSTWETTILSSMAESYDVVWETIDNDVELQRLTGKTGQETRANIEASILEEGIDAIFAGEIKGNFGMHQRSLVYAALARQHGKTDEWLDSIFTRTGSEYSDIGLNYALYNLIYRDGFPFESSPEYCFYWVRNITQIAEALKACHGAYNVYQIPKTKRIYDAVLDMYNIGRFTPHVGDSGDVYGSKVGEDAQVYQAAYRAYRERRYLRHLASFGATGNAGFKSYETLFYPAIESTIERPRPRRSRLLHGYGMGILNNPADTVSLSLYYGYKGSHGQFDRLHFDLFANGQPMMPDLGYPDFMNIYVSGIYTWSQNTVAHNTVTVDAGRQHGNQAGTVQMFADSPLARVLDVDAPETYRQCSTYRRHLLMVDVDETLAYFVDIFTVRGGHQHDYNLHGPPGTFRIIGGTWGKTEEGTLAGKNVPLGHIYDDPVLGAEGYAGGYWRYRGSGFQHLFNVRRHHRGPWVAEWVHEKNHKARLRVRILDQLGQQIILANAHVSPIKHKQLLSYVIARRHGAEPLASRFVTIIEPYSKQPFIEEARLMRLNSQDGVAVAIKLKSGMTDLVLYNPQGTRQVLNDYGIVTDAVETVVRVGPNGKPSKIFFVKGRLVTVGEHQVKIPPPIKGEVISVDPRKRRVRVRLDNASSPFNVESLTGHVAHFSNSIRRTTHPIVEALLNGDELILTTGDDILVGRAHLTGVEAKKLSTDTAFMFAPVYRGTVVTDVNFSRYYQVQEVTKDKILLGEPLIAPDRFKVGTDVWIVNIGPGDRLDIPLGWFIVLEAGKL